jgi:hypothetical protein
MSTTTNTVQDEAKIACVIEHLMARGGKYVRIDGIVATTTDDDGYGPYLDVYRDAELVAWYDRALASVRNDPDFYGAEGEDPEDVALALGETGP